MNHFSPRVLFALVALLCLGLSAPATADEVGGPLGDIEWGDDPSTVAEKVKDQLVDELRERDELKNDRARMHKERKKVIDKVEKFEATHEQLDSNSDYRVSVISDEFEKGRGHSLMRIKDENAQRFYFFDGGRLFKMVVAYNQDVVAGVDFDSFVTKTAERYGQPDNRLQAEVDGAQKMVQAIWLDPQTLLRIDDKKSFFDTFTMTFADRKVAEKMGNHGLVEGSSDKEGVSKRVESLTDPHRNPGDDGVVDDIVGESDVDLSEGRPNYLDEEEEEETDVDEIATDEDPASEASKKAQARQQKKEEQKRKKKKQKKKTDRDFSDIDSSSSDDGDDDLIIY